MKGIVAALLAVGVVCHCLAMATDVACAAVLERDEQLPPQRSRHFDREAPLRFPKPEHAYADNWAAFAGSSRPLRRWLRQDAVAAEHADVNMDEHVVTIRGATAEDARAHRHSVTKNGFELVTLHTRLLPVLQRIHEGGLDGFRSGPSMATSAEADEADMHVEEVLARRLQGLDTFELSGHLTYNFHCTGFVIRRGTALGRAAHNTSGADMVAQRVHIDSDLEGEPLLGMGLRWLFTRVPYMHILNVWTPLHALAIRPLALVDTSTQAEGDVLRYRANSTRNAGGRLGSFVADRLMTLHNAAQEWWWFPDMVYGQAIVFLTGVTPHSSFSLVDEETMLAEQLTLLLALKADRDAGKVSDNNNDASCPAHLLTMPDAFVQNSPPPVRELVRSTCRALASLCGARGDGDIETLRLLEETIAAISRSSLEIRCSAAIVPVAHAVALAAFATSAILFLLLRRTLAPKEPEKPKRKTQ